MDSKTSKIVYVFQLCFTLNKQCRMEVDRFNIQTYHYIIPFLIQEYFWYKYNKLLWIN